RNLALVGIRYFSAEDKSCSIIPPGALWLQRAADDMQTLQSSNMGGWNASACCSRSSRGALRAARSALRISARLPKVTLAFCPTVPCAEAVGSEEQAPQWRQGLARSQGAAVRASHFRTVVVSCFHTSSGI